MPYGRRISCPWPYLFYFITENHYKSINDRMSSILHDFHHFQFICVQRAHLQQNAQQRIPTAIDAHLFERNPFFFKDFERLLSVSLSDAPQLRFGADGKEYPHVVNMRYFRVQSVSTLNYDRLVRIDSRLSAEIADAVGCSTSTVHKYLNEKGVKENEC